MDFHQLESVLAVAELQSFTKAAEKVHVSQPTLSQQILNLENELGTRLFDRTTRSVTPTAAGRRFIIHAQRIMEEREQALRAVAESQDACSGTVRIGWMQIMAVYNLVEMVQAFSDECPNIEVVLSDSLTGGELMDLLRKGELDLALMNDLDSQPAAEGLPFVEDRLIAVVNPAHPLARHKTASWSLLKGERLILPRGNDILEKKITEKCALYGFAPNLFFRTSTLPIAGDFIARNLGIGLYSSNVAAAQLPNTVRLAFDDPILRTISLARARGKPQSPAARRFMQFAVDWRKNFHTK